MAGKEEEKKKPSEAKYEFTDKHKNVYESALTAVDMDKHIERTIKHRDAWAPALETMKGKKVTHFEDGIEMLADALIKYRKSAGLPVSEKNEDRHYIISEIEGIIGALIEREVFKGGKEEVEALFKEGKGHQILQLLLEQDYSRDIEGKIKYDVKKNLKKDFESPKDEFDFYHGVRSYHAHKVGEKLTTGELAKGATRDNVLNLFAGLYKTEISDRLKFMKYKPPTKTGKEKETTYEAPVKKK